MKDTRILWIGTRSAYDLFIRRTSGNIEYYLLSGRDSFETSKTIRFDGYIKDDSYHKLSNILDIEEVIKNLDRRLFK